MPDNKALFAALQEFAATVTRKYSQVISGEPEDQLRSPFEVLMQNIGAFLGIKIVCTGEMRLSGRIGKPDYGISSDKVLAGYVELKAPGLGANPNRFTGRNKDQWKRFKAIPNLIYTDGNEWALYRDGNLIGKLVSISGDVTTDGKKAVNIEDAENLYPLLADFLSWQPIVPKEAKALAELIAPLCRMLRDDVVEALKDTESPLVQLADDWRQLLFPNADDEQFADAYAQTVTFALLLARSEGASPLSLESAVAALSAEHSLLSRALQVLTDPKAQAEISASLNMVIRIIGAMSPDVLTGPKEPWLYFYEDFLAAYDPKLRKDAGAYYTPVQVVHAQVRLIDDLLTNRLGKSLGYADPSVIILDPAVGTGTYLLGVIDHVLNNVKSIQGAGAVPAQGSSLAKRIFGFEIMVGPYAVSELRISRAFLDRKAKLPVDGPGIYLTDTLESPYASPPRPPLYLQPLAEQHKKALEIKEKVQVIVCLGNPPYDRHESADETNKTRTGNWIRWGDDGKGIDSYFRSFLDPVLESGHGVHAKNLYNLYVYFWRWALWKVFEHNTASGPGIVSFISASSYMEGDAFAGMRQHMRRVCDEIWIIDLGGEGRGTRKSENVFDIQTPVAIAVAIRYKKTSSSKPAKIHYTRIEGTRAEKLKVLEAISTLLDLKWKECSDGWQDPFRPSASGEYFEWPVITDLFPWQHTGVEVKRTWPIAPDKDTLKRRWRELLSADDRAKYFKETRDRKVEGSYQDILSQDRQTPISKLPSNTDLPQIEHYAFRSFDRQWLIADSRVGDFLKPVLWRTYSNKQVFMTSLFNHPLGTGPALTACSSIPDRHHLRGSYGGKDVIALYRDPVEPNILPSFLDMISDVIGSVVKPEDFFAYVYSMLAHPAFTRIFREELSSREIRVPITRNADLFLEASTIGKRLLWLHTYGQRFVPKGFRPGQVPKGKAKNVKGVSDDPGNYPERYEYNEEKQSLLVGDGEFAPVMKEVWEFEVSGLKVVKSWLDYRMKAGHGRRSSPLDQIRPERWSSQFTTELLELIWVLEATISEYPLLENLLKEIINGPVFTADELPVVPDSARKAPGRSEEEPDLFENEE